MFLEHRGARPRVHPSAFVAPTACLIGDVEVGEESSVWFGAVVRGDNGPIRIGARTSVQDNAVIHVSEGSSTIVGDDVTIGHAAVMEDCIIENRALIGSNAVVLNGATVGTGSMIAAGSVVGANVTIPSHVLAAGAPATVRKPIEGEAALWIEHGAQAYVRLSRAYLSEGIGVPADRRH
ncbi:MAG: gamma carbonic anhydrase family protein [Candidatus Tyrphobacter sp.]